MGGRAEGLACADPGARTPIGASGNFFLSLKCLSSIPASLIYTPLLSFHWEVPGSGCQGSGWLFSSGRSYLKEVLALNTNNTDLCNLLMSLVTEMPCWNIMESTDWNESMFVFNCLLHCGWVFVWKGSPVDFSKFWLSEYENTFTKNLP